MYIYLTLVFFIFGTIIGSFLNVVINRINTGRSLNGRSFCPICSTKINWYDLIPILSWIILRGKCRNCHSKISAQYPLVEFFTGLLFVFLFIEVEPLILSSFSVFVIFFVWVAIIFSILVVIFAYDLKHKIIPDFLSYTFAIMALIQTLVLVPIAEISNLSVLLDLFAGVIFFVPFFLLWFISQGKWIGLGDGKLVLGIGWFLGFNAGLNALVFAFWLGAIVSVTLILIQKFMLIGKLKKLSSRITMKSEIPFGPFLIIATIVEFFFRYDFIGISFFLK